VGVVEVLGLGKLYLIPARDSDYYYHKGKVQKRRERECGD